MKQLGLLVTVSFFSAFFAIMLYRQMVPPQVVIKERVPAQFATLRGEAYDLLSGIPQREWRSSAPTDFIAAAKRVTPAVVNIRAMASGKQDWWGGGGAATGSGVIISPDGLIVTNNHVIEGSDELQITLNDHREFRAEVLGTDPSTDLALIKIDAEGLPWVVFGNSDSLQVGEWVLAVGNPFNLESTVTAGIVSAKGRNIDILEEEYSIESFIQTDAAVNPGNSGGALVNTNGELVGINTAIITRSGRYEGYSFAIPANLVQKVVRDLRDFGRVRRGILGVRIGPVTAQRAEALGLPSVEGVYISGVTPNGGADKAGLRRGDVIVAVNGITTPSVPALQEIVGRYRPGDVLDITYIRDGKRHRTRVTLMDKDQPAGAFVSRDLDLAETLGFELRDLSREEQLRLGTKGVYVESITPGSTIHATSMDPGYIITRVNDQYVSSVDELLVILAQNRGKKVMLEGFYEEYPGEYYYTFRVGE